MGTLLEYVHQIKETQKYQSTIHGIMGEDSEIKKTNWNCNWVTTEARERRILMQKKWTPKSIWKTSFHLFQTRYKIYFYNVNSVDIISNYYVICITDISCIILNSNFMQEASNPRSFFFYFLFERKKRDGEIKSHKVCYTNSSVTPELFYYSYVPLSTVKNR